MGTHKCTLSKRDLKILEEAKADAGLTTTNPLQVFHDPRTGEIITKQEALNIAILQGRVLVSEKMTIKEAKKRGYKIPKSIERITTP